MHETFFNRNENHYYKIIHLCFHLIRYYAVVLLLKSLFYSECLVQDPWSRRTEETIIIFLLIYLVESELGGEVVVYQIFLECSLLFNHFHYRQLNVCSLKSVLQIYDSSAVVHVSCGNLIVNLLIIYRNN